MTSSAENRPRHDGAWACWFLRVAGAMHLLLAVACQSPRSGAASVTQAQFALGVPDTCIYVDDVPGGADVTFTTTPPYVVQLRSRVAEQAAMNGPGRHLGAGHRGEHGASDGHGLRLWGMPVHGVHQVDVGRGVRLEVVANASSNVDELRAQLRERAAKLSDRACP